MPTLRVIWDVLFKGDKVTEKGTDGVVARAMDEHCSDQKVEAILRWNTVLEGQKVSRAGTTSGLRYHIPINHLTNEEVFGLCNSLRSFSHEACVSSDCRISESLEFPLSRSAKLRFPVLGTIALSCRFTHGMGYTDLKKIQNAKTTQTKETKEGLNPIGTGKGSSGGRFTKEFRSTMDNPAWFLVLPTSTTEGYKPPSEVLSRGSDGGMYQLSFDLRNTIEGLASASRGAWWKPLDSENLSLNPKLTVDPSEILESNLDPARLCSINYPGGSSESKAITRVLDVEMEQTGEESFCEDLQYVLGRLTRRKRVARQITGDSHGLVSELEEALISKHVIRPWIAEEFFNCLALFLMTRKPKYWRNGKSEITLLHPTEGLDLDELKD